MILTSVLLFSLRDLVVRAKHSFAAGVPKSSQKNIMTCLSKDERYRNFRILAVSQQLTTSSPPPLSV
jgi:hypothetical protein